MTARDADVLVFGAGPTGLLIASELHRLGVDVLSVERRADTSPGSRAIGVHPPTLAALAPSGATEQILAEAVKISRGLAQTGGKTLGEVRFDRAAGPFPFIAAVPQAVTEAAVGAGAPLPRRGVSVLALRQDTSGVVATVQGPALQGEPYELRARIAVVAAGAPGRGLLDAAFGVSAYEYPDRYLMTDIPAAPTQPRGVAIITLDQAGVLESFPLPGGGRRLVAWVGRGGVGSGAVVGTEATAAAATTPETTYAATAASDDPTRGALLRRAVAERTGDEALAAEVSNAQGFGIRRVLLRHMRVGRIFAIGDSAHEVSPIGGQGMNLGLLDAATLAPILARGLRGRGLLAEVDRWERRRIASARTAVRLAGANTSMGRARSAPGHAAATIALGAALSWPTGRLAAHAYAMGLDRDARPLQ